VFFKNTSKISPEKLHKTVCGKYLKNRSLVYHILNFMNLVLINKLKKAQIEQ